MKKRHEFSLNMLATWFGCGRAPWAPGTVGTIGAIPLVWLFQRLGATEYMFATFGFTVVAMLIAQIYEAGGSEHDPSEFVLDEVAGFLVTMTWLPFTWTWLLLGFALFRLLDVVKPFPISYIDRKVPGGVGCVADDLLAGIIANACLQIALQNSWFNG